MTATHSPIIDDDGRPACSCGSTAEQWHPSHGWETALVCCRSRTPIATADTLAAMNAQNQGRNPL